MLQAVTQRTLERLVSDFDSNPVAARRAIQEQYVIDPEKFRRNVMAILAAEQDTKAVGYLLSFLIQNDRLAVRLGDPDLCTKEEAIRIARRASRVDPTFERQIAQLLMGGLRLEDAEVARLLSVLESIAPPSNLVPVLSAIMHHDNPKVRSKAALMMGRGKRNCAWVEEQLTEPDGRVRANAVESIWGLDGADVLEVFSTAVQDPVPRVAINGAIGLYRARQTRSVELLLTWAEDARFEFRRSACWGMGQTLDPRFLPMLAKRVRDSEPTVRSNALRAASTIRSHLSVLKQDPLTVHLGRVQVLENGVRLVPASLRRPGASVIPILCPLSFAIDEDGVPVTRYEIARATPDATGSVGVVLPLHAEIGSGFPAALRTGLRSALDAKRSAEGWATACYSHGDEHGVDTPPLLQNTAEQVEKGFELAARSYRSGVFPAIESLLPILPQGPKAILVIGNETAESTTIVFQRDAHAAGALAMLRHHGVAVHAMVLPGCTPIFRSTLQKLAGETGGRLYSISSPADLEQQLVAALATLHCEYKIRYWGFEENTSPQALQVVVTTPSSYGEARTSTFEESR